ncbi:hypothetical protein HH310_12390 [Actinoplanes sp. TBRC 11911]|uniref:hypothetical protein n=1 Tax=Actinoplanes sp. TBRC 11911 TaxID=2729386 RepID=UPI00145D111D|nr:hypothetical protein [Actinoplanes sp. TBRC 11911]NMO51992.1 hypothetical protein [Actinoplanes sp. TBRC 11911]
MLIPDVDVAADFFGNRRCSSCGLMGKPGDAHHTDPAAPQAPRPARRIRPEIVEAAAEREAAILGEKEDVE